MNPILVPVAQYLRMSTEHQQYSLQNQAERVKQYADEHNFGVIQTYSDAAKSGLVLRSRKGLQQLLKDVVSGAAGYRAILVYDVSRWGRFQDVDESAYYEFLCKQNGIKVIYCAEQFEDDGSLLSSIIKNIKRVMAAEFSRELSVKVHTGQCRVASLGFRVGAPIGFGLRRELVDEKQVPKGLLKNGQRKALQTDRVKLRAGTPDEANVIRLIFDLFVAGGLDKTKVARRLNEMKIPNKEGGKWTDHIIDALLKNEAYIGNLVHNRVSRRLARKRVKNPPDQWVRKDGVLEPVVAREVFTRAQKILAERRVVLSEDEMLRRLRLLLHRKGKLTMRIIDKAVGVPSPGCLFKHFGSLRNAYAKIGYVSERDCRWLDTRRVWEADMVDKAAQLAASIKSHMRRGSTVKAVGADVFVNGSPYVSFILARQEKRRRPNHAPRWRARRRQRKLGKMLIALRLDDASRRLLDYILIPAAMMPGSGVWIPRLRLPGGMRRAKTFSEVIAKLKKPAGLTRQ